MNSGGAVGISAYAVDFGHRATAAPLLTSPVHGGGTPSPRAGRVGVGAMLKSHCEGWGGGYV